MKTRFVDYCKKHYKQIIFVVIYLIAAIFVSKLVYKWNSESNKALYTDVEFERVGDDYYSDIMTMPDGIFNTVIVYSCPADTQVVITADGQIIAQMDVRGIEGYDAISLINGTTRSTSDYRIIFQNVGDSRFDVPSIEITANKALCRDDLLRALTAGFSLVLILIYILLVINRKINFAQAVVILILSAFSFFVSSPLMSDYILAGHDLWGMCGRIEGIKDALNCGQTFPVVLPNAFNGYGYLGFMYPELFLLFPATLRKYDVTMVTAYHLYLYVINFATTFIAYVSVKSVLSELVNNSEDKQNSENKLKAIGVCCALFYLMAPYRLTDLYIRAAVGEAVSMTFIPLAIAGLFHVITGNRKKWYMLVLGLSGILHSHILSCMMVIPVLVIISIFYLKKIFAEKRWKELIYSVVTFFVVNSFYVFPFIKFYLFGLNTDALIVDDVENHTVLLSKLFSTSAGYINDDSMILSIGVASFAAIIIAAILFVERGAAILDLSKTENVETNNASVDPAVKLMGIISGLGFVYLLFSLDIIPWEWICKESELIKGLVQMLQFPFRLLTVVMACIMFMLGIALLKSKVLVKYDILVMVVLVVVALTECSSFIDKYETKTVAMRRYTGGFENHVPEDYLPAGIDTSIFADKTAHIENGVIECIKDGTNITLNYSSDVDTVADVPLLYYPCYKAVDENGNKISLFNTDSKKIGINLPAGSHTVSIKAKLF